MIEAIKEIGKYSLEKKGKSLDRPFDILVGDPANRYTKNILFIVLESEGKKFSYKGVSSEEYSKEKLGKYAYKKGSSRSADMTPTSMITNVESTFKKVKILPWFTNYTTFGEDDDENFLVKIGNCLRENSEDIINDLKDNNSAENNIISLKIDNKYIGDYEVFRRILVDRSKNVFYSKYGKVSKSENQLCSVCNQKKAEVYGFVGTYKFYTVDKIGFVSGGFNQKDAWKNYPVCLNCALALEEGKNYIGKNINFNFYGFQYILIPKFTMKVDYETKISFFKNVEKQQNPKFRQEEIKRLTSDEKEMLEFMSEQKNYLNLNFMFYDAPKGYDGTVFKILLYIEDVLPSRLKKLFDVKKYVDAIDIFKECMIPVSENKKRTGEKPLEFNFGILWDFFYDRRNKRWISKKYFLDIVNKIFKNKPIDFSFLMNFIMQEIRGGFIKDNPTKVSTLKGFMLLNYLKRLGILNKEGSSMNDKDVSDQAEKNELKQNIKSFFERFEDFFDSDAKKSVFLEGVLTQKLLNIQYSDRKGMPFRNKLKGLNLDEKQIKRLLPQIQNKLEEYNKNYYKLLESVISEHFVMAGNNWKMQNDEISFYFVLGMNLSNLFKTGKEVNNGGEENV